jgi:hypothetical protein
MIIQTADENGEPYTLFDFDKIVPAPPILNQIEAGSRSQLAAQLIILRGEHDAWFLEPFTTKDYAIAHIRGNVDMPDASMGKVAAAYLKKHPEEEEQGRLWLQSILETGHASWYSWNIANWGTKWNSYRFRLLSDDPLEFSFETAWSFPWPVFEALAHEFPTLQFNCGTYEEMGSFTGDGCFNPGPGERPFELTERGVEFVEVDGDTANVATARNSEGPEGESTAA